MSEILVELKDYYIIGEVVIIDDDSYEVIDIDYVDQLAVLEKI